MWDLGTAQAIAVLVLLGTAAAGALLGRAVARGARPGDPVVARRRPLRGTEGAWLALILVGQVWALGVLFVPSDFYDWPPLALPLAGDLQDAGLGLWALGGGLVLWSTLALGRFMTPEIRLTRGQDLVEAGPYRWVRHPTYEGNVLVAGGLGLAFLSVPMLLVALLIGALAAYRARIEDAFLASPMAFGARYEAYMTRTGRFLPRRTRR